ncbi:MAG: hypothetical protein NT027_03895 [Proteobacteria bacterium]|nr:hypothetical protein [Pseudomonadota bacterium]
MNQFVKTCALLLSISADLAAAQEDTNASLLDQSDQYVYSEANQAAEWGTTCTNCRVIMSNAPDHCIRATHYSCSPGWKTSYTDVCKNKSWWQSGGCDL